MEYVITFNKTLHFYLFFSKFKNLKKCQSVPTTMPTTINNWQSSVEKSQAHNLKFVGSNLTLATNYINKIIDEDHPQRLWFLGVFLFRA